VVVSPLDGGARWSSGVDLLPRRPGGTAVLPRSSSPSPGTAGRWIWRSKFCKMLVLFRAATTAASGVDPPGSALGDFPLAWGCSRSMASRGVGAAARHRQHWGVAGMVVL
jgi:hypothetical protein